MFGRSASQPTAPFEGWGFLWRPALIGFLALVAIAVGASFTNSPFKFETPGTWFFGVPTKPVNLLAPVNSDDDAARHHPRLRRPLALSCASWIRLASVALRHPGAPIARLGWMLALWILPMLVIAPIFSRDVFSYAAQGEMVTRHISPYSNGPSSLGSGPFPDTVDHVWWNSPPPTDRCSCRSTAGSSASRATPSLGPSSGCASSRSAPSRSSPSRCRCSRAASASTPATRSCCASSTRSSCSPLVGGAHNDGLMMALLVAGLALAVKKHPVLGIIACALAASIKAPAALGIVYIAWEWLGPNLPVRMRLRPLAVAGIAHGRGARASHRRLGLGLGWVTNLDDARDGAELGGAGDRPRDGHRGDRPAPRPRRLDDLGDLAHAARSAS